MKISKTVKDRFKVSANGKIIRRKMGQRHLKINKRRTTIRRGKRPIILEGSLEKKVRNLLGI